MNSGSFWRIYISHYSASKCVFSFSFVYIMTCKYCFWYMYVWKANKVKYGEYDVCMNHFHLCTPESGYKVPWTLTAFFKSISYVRVVFFSQYMKYIWSIVNKCISCLHLESLSNSWYAIIERSIRTLRKLFAVCTSACVLFQAVARFGKANTNIFLQYLF